jgi:type II secretion system protein N
MRILLLVLLAALVIPVAAWIIVVPESAVLDVMCGPLRSRGLTIETEGFAKGPLISVTAEKATLRWTGQAGKDLPLLTATDVSARLNFPSLLRFRPRVDVEGKIGAGSLSGHVAITGTGDAEVKGGGIPIGDIPFLRSSGFDGEGRLSFDLRREGGDAEIKLTIEDARIMASSLKGVPLPFDLFQRMRGLIVLSRGSTEITSLALEGNGIYGRLKGAIKDAVLTGTIEASIDTSVRDNALIAAAIRRYMVTPGYYVIPVSQQLSQFSQ